MNNDKRFIQVDDHKRRLGDDEFTKYIQKDRYGSKRRIKYERY